MGLKLREPFAAGSHLLGAAASLIAGIYLIIVCDGSYLAVVGAVVYSFALLFVFLVSGLFHGVQCCRQAERLEVLDYAAIYLFIAGTYTPVCLFVIPGSFGNGMLVAIWLLAATGILLCLYRGIFNRTVQTVVYVAMGWAFLIALPTIDRVLDPLPFNLMLLGGSIYTLGALIFLLDWPRLFGRISAHDCWHMLVLLGSASHYLMILEITP